LRDGFKIKIIYLFPFDTTNLPAISGALRDPFDLLDNGLRAV